MHSGYEVMAVSHTQTGSDAGSKGSDGLEM